MQTDATIHHFETTLRPSKSVERRDALDRSYGLAFAPVDSAAPHSAAELTVVITTYSSERENVNEVVRRVAAALKGVAWEIVFVDDDSPDGTADLVKSLARNDSRIRCIRRVGHRGLSGACVESILSSGEPVVATDAQSMQCTQRVPAEAEL